MVGDVDGDPDGEIVGDEDGDSVGDEDGDEDGDSEGDADGDEVGDSEGDADGDRDGDAVGDVLGDSDGDADGDAEGEVLGKADGDREGESDGDTDGAHSQVTVLDIRVPHGGHVGPVSPAKEARISSKNAIARVELLSPPPGVSVDDTDVRVVAGVVNASAVVSPISAQFSIK